MHCKSVKFEAQQWSYNYTWIYYSDKQTKMTSRESGESPKLLILFSDIHKIKKLTIYRGMIVLFASNFQDICVLLRFTIRAIFIWKYDLEKKLWPNICKSRIFFSVYELAIHEI